MQERVLGAIIIGAIALCGVAWGTIEGGIVNATAKKEEKSLEKSLYTLVKELDSSVTTLDTRSASYYKAEAYEKVWMPGWGPKDDPGAYDDIKVIVPYVRIYGYTNDNKEFKIVLKTRQELSPLDLDAKKITYVVEEDEAKYEESDKYKDSLKHQLTVNYAKTCGKYFRDEIVNNETTEIVSYVVGGVEKLTK